MAKNGIWLKKKFREIDLFDFTSLFDLDFFKYSGPLKSTGYFGAWYRIENHPDLKLFCSFSYRRPIGFEIRAKQRRVHDLYQSTFN